MTDDSHRALVEKVAVEQWNLRVTKVKVIQTVWGNRLAWIDGANGDRYALKRPVRTHTHDSIEKACRFSNFVDSRLQEGTKGSESGSVRILRFLPLKTSCEGRQYLHVTTTTDEKGILKRFVCSQFIPNTFNLREAQEETWLTREAARLHMAKALGVLHSFASHSRKRLDDMSATDWWYGSITERLKLPLKELQTATCSEILENLEKQQDVLSDRVFRLPKFPATSDLQSKNFIISKESGSITIVNTEVLMLATRLWDVLYLLVMDDFCSGFGEDESNLEWMPRFAAALGVYYSHLKAGGGEDDELKFTEEEIELFPLILQVKLAQVAALGFERNCKVLGKVSLWADSLKDILRRVHNPRSPNLGLASPSEPRFFQCFDRISNGNPNKKIKAILYFNGTYAPYHIGHLEAAVLAASSIEEQDEQVEVTGIAISPCKQSRVTKKLGENNSLVFSDVLRIALVDLSLNCCPADGDAYAYSKLLAPSKFNAFVDTNECIHHEANDLERYSAVVERFRETVNAVNESTNRVENFLPRVYCVCGDDVKDFISSSALTRKIKEEKWDENGLLHAIVVNRSDQSTKCTNTTSTAIPVLETCSSKLQISSTKIRKARQDEDWDEVSSLVGINTIAWMLAFQGHGRGEHNQL